MHEFDTVLLRWRPADASLYLPVASEAVLMAIGGEMFAALKNENRCQRSFLIKNKNILCSKTFGINKVFLLSKSSKKHLDLYPKRIYGAKK